MIIKLWDIGNFSGIIVPLKTGVIWTNQVGGTYCGHPELEGIFLPAVGEIDDDLSLSDLYQETYDLNLVQRFLNIWGLEDLFIPANPDDLSEALGPAAILAEAWVPLRINPECKVCHFEPFKHQKVVVLTYENSD